MAKIKIGDKYIGNGEPPYFIADIAANHDGELTRALKLIELAKEAGANAAKFQNFQAPKLVSKVGFEAMPGLLSHQKNWKKSVYETYMEASIPFEWTKILKNKCDEVGIDYFTSPYDKELIDIVDPYVEIFKIGSGDITWLEIIEYMASKGKPIILSTGASTMSDVERAMDLLKSYTKDIVLMQCNTNYTAQPENFRHINLNVLRTYSEKYPNAILGLSDHTPTLSTVLGAVVLGAKVFEKHFTDNNRRNGPDHKFAVTPDMWREMVDRANEVYLSLGDGVKKIESNENESAIIQRRGLRYVKDMGRGYVLRKEDLIPLRPIMADGIPPYEIGKLLGRKLKKAVKSDESAKWEDMEEC